MRHLEQARPDLVDLPFPGTGFLHLESDPLDQDQAQIARHQGLLTGVEIKPAHDANGWLLELTDTAGKHIPYTGHTGTEKVYHDLDQASALARELGFEGIRIEERF